jgi:membrane complex biogenesis BtpA family protein
VSRSVPVVPDRADPLEALFGVLKPVIGMIHVRPLPGAPRYQNEPMREITRAALSDAITCVEGGVDGLVVENGGDVPFRHPDRLGVETAVSLAVVAAAVRDAVDVPIGINVLANGVIQSIAVAKAVDAQFVRANQWVNAYVANEGIVQGAAAEALRYRSYLRAESVRVFADVHVKHGSHAIVADRSLAELTHDAEFFDADVLIATGQRTSDPTPTEEVLGVKSASTLPVIIGSGLNIDNVDELMAVAYGAIVGSSVKDDGVWWNPVSRERVAAIMERVRALRQAQTRGAQR